MDCLLVGAGAVAEDYAADLDRSTVAAVCDQREERAAALAERLNATAYGDLDAALAAESAPVAVNLTSHRSHAPVTRQALAADRHVYTEKPLAVDAGAAADLVALAETRDLALVCGPANHRNPGQRHAGRALVDGRTGPVRICYAHAHVGRVTEWHDRPGSFLAVGPLYDGGVYPLTLLVAWFGPVRRVRTADAVDAWPAREEPTPDAPAHVEATLEFGHGGPARDAGPVVRLTASLYVPHRSREFYGLELHGDDGSLFLRDAGALDAPPDLVSFGRAGRAYTPMPATERGPAGRADGVRRLVRAVERGARPLAEARRGAHVVAVCEAIERCASEGRPVAVADRNASAAPPPAPTVRPPRDDAGAGTGRDGSGVAGRRAAVRLPPIGFGRSPCRDGECVDRRDSIATALDAGYRLFDAADLSGNEGRIGDLLAAPGAPDRDALALVGTARNTNHEHVREACRRTRERLGVDQLDCYMLHWPEARSDQGTLGERADLPVDERKTETFPERDGERATGDVVLADAWERMEALHDEGWMRTLGIRNATVADLRDLLAVARVPPALVRVERHPYRPRRDLVQFCHDRGIRVMAHSPLSAPGLLEESALAAVADEHGCSPAAAVVAWNVRRGVVPVPSSTDPDRVVENLAAAGLDLDAAAMERIDGLADPDCER